MAEGGVEGSLHDIEGWYNDANSDVTKAVSTVANKLTEQPSEYRHDIAHWYDEANNDTVGGLWNALFSGGSKPAAPAAAKGSSTPEAPQNVETMGQEIAKALGPEEKEAAGLGGEYQSAIEQMNALPSGDQGPNAALNAAVDKTEGALEKGEGGEEKALGAIPGAINNLAADLPYADILSTMLTEKKNQLMYGTVPTYQPSTTGWSASLKDIYGYINGKLAGGTTTGAGPTASDTLPSIQTELNASQGSTTVPGNGGGSQIGG